MVELLYRTSLYARLQRDFWIRGCHTQFATEVGDDRVSLKSMVGRLLLEKTGVVPGIELVNSLMTKNETLDSNKLFQA